MPAIVKILISAATIWVVNEIVVKHSKPLIGSMIASLPLVSLLTFMWIYHDMRDRPAEAVDRLAAHSIGIFWFVLPTLPMFLVFPMLLKKGIGFWPSMGIVCLGTALLYALTAKFLVK
jgi:hypothetical protein